MRPISAMTAFSRARRWASTSLSLSEASAWVSSCRRWAWAMAPLIWEATLSANAVSSGP